MEPRRGEARRGAANRPEGRPYKSAAVAPERRNSHDEVLLPICLFFARRNHASRNVCNSHGTSRNSSLLDIGSRVPPQYVEQTRLHSHVVCKEPYVSMTVSLVMSVSRFWMLSTILFPTKVSRTATNWRQSLSSLQIMRLPWMRSRMARSFASSPQRRLSSSASFNRIPSMQMRFFSQEMYARSFESSMQNGLHVSGYHTVLLCISGNVPVDSHASFLLRRHENRLQLVNARTTTLHAQD